MNYNFKDKAENINSLNDYMLLKTLTMFEWENLPDTIPKTELERLLQVSGYAFICEHDGELYAFNGGLGGVPDEYNRPTEITINNPHLKLNKTFKLSEGILILNDDLKIGLMPLFNKYHFMLAENDINMILYGYMNRMNMVISATDDRTKESAERYIEKSIGGEFAIIGENALFDGVKVQTAHSSQGTSVSGLIQLHQYLKGSLYNEVGLPSAFNLKKERLITSEVEQQNEGIYSLVYNMLSNRLQAVEKLNELFNLEIAVALGSVWAKNINSDVERIDDVITESGITDEPTDKTESIDLDTDEETDELNILTESVEDLTESVEDLTDEVEELLNEVSNED